MSQQSGERSGDPESDGLREWPSSGFDSRILEAKGWRPIPFQEFILKIHGTCNLACDYCYVYESADQSWASRPVTMPESTVARVADRIAQHAERHGLASVDVVLHGGEPLMAGRHRIDAMARLLRGAVPSTCRVDISLQTNGTLLNERMLDVLASHGIGVAVSVDGDGAAHDRHRRYANGRGSHQAVQRGLALLTDRYRPLFRGLLCTVDLANDPVDTLEALLESGPPQVNFLLPHGSWSEPPPHLTLPRDGGTPYADWLIPVFDRWALAPGATGVRLFQEIMNLLLGGHSESEGIGLSPVAMLVIDTDGSLQQVDSLKTSFAGAPETGLTVFDHDFDLALAHPGVVARQIGLAALSDTCMACDVRDICGGGNYVHRFRAGDGYHNPSVYCDDLRKLIRHISGAFERQLVAMGAPASPRNPVPSTDSTRTAHPA